MVIYKYCLNSTSIVFLCFFFTSLHFNPKKNSQSSLHRTRATTKGCVCTNSHKNRGTFYCRPFIPCTFVSALSHTIFAIDFDFACFVCYVSNLSSKLNGWFSSKPKISGQKSKKNYICCLCIKIVRKSNHLVPLLDVVRVKPGHGLVKVLYIVVHKLATLIFFFICVTFVLCQLH